MYGRQALLVVLLLSLGRQAHQQSAATSGDSVPAGRVKSLPVDIGKLHGASAADKRHIGKFVRIGRTSSDDAAAAADELRSDDALWSLYYAPELSQRRLGSRRRRSDSTTLYDTRPRKERRSERLRDTDASVVNEVAEDSRSRRGGGVRFVRIGKRDGRRRTNAKASDDMNVFRRSLENRFVRIGK